MRKLIALVALISTIALSGPGAWAAPTGHAFNDVPSRFKTSDLTAGSRALGEICHSRATMPDGTVCSPAFLGEEISSGLMGRIYVGNGYTAISTANQMVFEPLSKEFLQDLFKRGNVNSLELHAGLSFWTRHFSASFSPYRVQYLSEIHNPNFPVLAAHASVERTMNFGTGFQGDSIAPWLKHFHFGGRVRILQRQFVHGSISLFQAFTDDLGNLLPVTTQRALYLDPAIGFARPLQISRYSWKVRSSLSVKNLGKIWHPHPLYPDRKDLDFGIGFEPGLKFGKLQFGVDFVDLIHGESLKSRMRIGSSYQFGILELSGGFNENAITSGMQIGFQMLQLGIVYEFSRKDFSGTSAGSKISTEFGIRI